MIREGSLAGYTMVEVMVFLAITAALFVGAVTAVGGNQAQVQFSQGVRDAQSKIEQIVNEVSSGYYANANNFTCRVVNPASAASAPTFTSTTSDQGTSDDCIFLGKALQFGQNNGTDYNVISIAARRHNRLGKEVKSLEEALPTALVNLPGGATTTESNNLDFGIKVTRIMVPSQPKSGGTFPASAYNATTYGSVAFLSSLATFDSVTGDLASGSPRVSFAAVPSTSLADTENAAATAIGNMTDAAAPAAPKQRVVVNPPNGIVICLADQADSKKAMLVVGGGVSQTAVELNTDASYSTVVCP